MCGAESQTWKYFEAQLNRGHITPKNSLSKLIQWINVVMSGETNLSGMWRLKLIEVLFSKLTGKNDNSLYS